MNRLLERLRAAGEAAALLSRAAVLSLSSHLALALFSVVAAFGIWVAIQDVDNPRVEGEAPAQGGIEVTAVNVPDGYIADEIQPVRVRVNAREGDLEDLRPSDFSATVDMSAVGRDGNPEARPVRVESKRKGVDVLVVIPTTREVSLIRADTRDMPVTVRVVAPPPAGFAASESPALSPPIVRISGRQELVESVQSVDLEANLASARDATFSVEGALVARGASGNTIEVQIVPARAKATFKIEEVFSQRTLGLAPLITGAPAPGFVITEVSVDPVLVQVSGPKQIVDGLQGPIALEAVDVTGARQTVTATRALQRPPNVSTDRQNAVVRIVIAPIDCSGEQGARCQSVTWFLAPVIEGLPQGLVVDASALRVQVRVSGPLDQLGTLKSSDFRAVISLTGATAGTATYTARVTGPPGLRIDSVEPVTLTLLPANTP